jgi:hypothetical protein
LQILMPVLPPYRTCFYEQLYSNLIFYVQVVRDICVIDIRIVGRISSLMIFFRWSFQ